MPRPPTNLPEPLTSFVGREPEIAETRRLLASSRLVTLTGPGGCGKTRLALEVAAGVLPEYPDGVWVAELAPVSDGRLVAQAVAATLGLGEEQDEALASTLPRHLRDRRLLLVLDNCDHVAGACARLADALLRACPGVRILATTRETLGLAGETTWVVPPLAVPDAGRLPSLDDLARVEAIRLFCERAAAIAPGFALTAGNAFAVTQICRRLDGIPLAIELAAARVRVLTVEQIVERLDDRFRLLTGGSRTAEPRQRTLRATVDWSHHLLSEPEEILFRRLAVFAGGFGLDAVEAIAAGDGIEPGSVLDLLSHLVDKSLVVAEPHDGRVRYRLLETIRHYAIDKLREAGEDEALRLGHRDWCVAFADEPSRDDREASPTAWIERLEREHDNLRAALRWSFDRGDVETGLRLCVSLYPFWRTRGYLSEAARWFDAGLRERSRVPGALRAKALELRGWIAGLRDDAGPAAALHEEALAAFQALGDRGGVARSLLNLGGALADRGEAARGRGLLDESLAIFRDLGDQRGVGLVLNRMAIAAMRDGDYGRATALYEESLALRRALGYTIGIAGSLNNLGLLALLEGDYERAAERLDESLALNRTMGETVGTAIALANLGRAALYRGQPARAAALLGDSLDLFEALEARGGLGETLERLGEVAAQSGDSAVAAGLLGAANAIRESIEMPLDAPDRTFHDRAVEAARSRLGDDAFSAAWAEGAAQGPAGAAALARAWLRERWGPAAPPAPARPAAAGEEALRLHGLGAARVFRGEHMLAASEWTYAKARELLYFLLTYPSRTKEQIGLALWPDASAGQLRSSFRVTLYHLRRALGRPDRITFSGNAYAFNRDLGYWFDVEAFESAVAEARAFEASAPARAIARLHEAVSLYRGEFLEDLVDGDWHLLRREQLAKLHVEALAALGRLAFSQGAYEQAADAYRRMIAHDAYLETAHRELMRCLARMGERGQALRHYRAVVDRMRDELGAPPDPATTALAERLRRGEAV